MRGKALVLSGGGAKGAYEAGVWKALHEKNIINQIGMISGTSAGALNAALFAQGNVEEVIDVWSNVQRDHILTSNDICSTCSSELAKEEKQMLFEFLQLHHGSLLFKIPFLNKLGSVLYKWLLAKLIASLEASLTIQLAKTLVPCFLNILMQLKTKLDFESAILKTLYFMEQIVRDGLFSQKGLEKILEEHLHENLLLQSPMTTYATAYNISKLKLEHFHLHAFNVNDHKKILLASSAIPFIFDQIEIQQHYYIDGGIPLLGDNTPIDVVYEKGYRDIIVVVLNAKEMKLQKYKDANITIVQPKESLGSSLASLDFDDAYTRNLIQKGYDDAMAIL